MFVLMEFGRREAIAAGSVITASAITIGVLFDRSTQQSGGSARLRTRAEIARQSRMYIEVVEETADESLFRDGTYIESEEFETELDALPTRVDSSYHFTVEMVSDSESPTLESAILLVE